MKKIILTLCALLTIPVFVKAAPQIISILESETRYDIVVTEETIKDQGNFYGLKIATKQDLLDAIENNQIDFEYYIEADRNSFERYINDSIMMSECTDNPDRVREPDHRLDDPMGMPLCPEYEAPAQEVIKARLTANINFLDDNAVICEYNANLTHGNFAEIPFLQVFEVSDQRDNLCPENNPRVRGAYTKNALMNAQSYEGKFQIRYGHLEVNN